MSDQFTGGASQPPLDQGVGRGLGSPPGSLLPGGSDLLGNGIPDPAAVLADQLGEPLSSRLQHATSSQFPTLPVSFASPSFVPLAHPLSNDLLQPTDPTLSLSASVSWMGAEGLGMAGKIPMKIICSKSGKIVRGHHNGAGEGDGDDIK